MDTNKDETISTLLLALKLSTVSKEVLIQSRDAVDDEDTKQFIQKIIDQRFHTI